MKELIHTPDGVRDIYGDELKRKLGIEEKIKNVIYSYGYEDIQTPTFEFFDVFSKEIGTTPSNELYKFFDKEGNTLCLRPDFTPSVARCVSKYFSDEKGPIRLTYKGNTFVNNSSLQGKLKEDTEIGVELIGDDSFIADAETINLCIEILKGIGLSDFQISIGHMDYFKGLCEDSGIDEEKELLLREHIASKNFVTAEEILKENVSDENVVKLMIETSMNISSISVIKDTLKRNINLKSKNALLRLEKIYEVLKVFGNEKYVSFDLGLLSRHNYYTGVIFKAYTYGLGDALIKGGRYDNLLSAFGTNKPAIGFVAVVDDCLLACRSQGIKIETPDAPKKMYVTENNYETVLKDVIEKRKNGGRVSLEVEG